MTQLPSIITLVLLWTVWCFLHSLLISRGFTAGMKTFLGSRFRYYRFAYNVFSLLSLAPVIYVQLSLEERIIFAWPWPWSIMKYCMYGAAAVLFYGGARVYNLPYMLGIRQMRQPEKGRKAGAAELTTRGILGYVRHPWYSGAIFLVWAFGRITDVSLAVKIVLTVYIIIGTVLEERKLVHEFGQRYIAYRSRVPMLIPWKIFTLLS